MSVNPKIAKPVPGSLPNRLRRVVVLHWRRGATAAAAVLVVSMAYHVVFGQNGLTAYEHKRQDARSLTREAATLARENERLKDHVTRLQSDPGAIEHAAREELHYARPGEVIFTLPASPDGSPHRAN